MDNNPFDNSNAPNDNSFNKQNNQTIIDQNQSYQSIQNQIPPNILETQRNKTDAILNECIKIRNNAIENYKLLKIEESIELLKKERKSLLRIKDYIEKKAVYLNDYLQYITKKITENNKLLNEYVLGKYLKFPEIFKYKPKDKTSSTIKYINQYILETPFITFNDIFDPTEPTNENNLKNYLYTLYQKVIVSRNKTLLLYGPKGCGKSIAAMAIANYIQAKFIQIDNPHFFQVDSFPVHLFSLCIDRQPIVVYIKNIDTMFPVLSSIYFLFDRILNSKRDDKIFLIASSTCKPNQLPEKLYHSFIYLHYIGTFILKYKKEYVRFICEKLNITLNVSNDEFEKLCSESFKYYSNEDIRKVLSITRDLNESNQHLINGNVLNFADLIHGSSLVPSSITTEVIKLYNL